MRSSILFQGCCVAFFKRLESGALSDIPEHDDETIEALVAYLDYFAKYPPRLQQSAPHPSGPGGLSPDVPQ